MVNFFEYFKETGRPWFLARDGDRIGVLCLVVERDTLLDGQLVVGRLAAISKALSSAVEPRVQVGRWTKSTEYLDRSPGRKREGEECLAADKKRRDCSRNTSGRSDLMTKSPKIKVYFPSPSSSYTISPLPNFLPNALLQKKEERKYLSLKTHIKSLTSEPPREFSGIVVVSIMMLVGRSLTSFDRQIDEKHAVETRVRVVAREEDRLVPGARLEVQLTLDSQRRSASLALRVRHRVRLVLARRLADAERRRRRHLVHAQRVVHGDGQRLVVLVEGGHRPHQRRRRRVFIDRGLVQRQGNRRVLRVLDIDDKCL